MGNSHAKGGSTLTSVTQKHIDISERGPLKVVAVGCQGYRPYMEDTHDVKLGVSLPKGIKDVAWLMLADGHGGTFASKYAAKHLLSRLLFADWSLCSEKNISYALEKSFLDLDEELSKQPCMRPGTHEYDSGSTVLCCVLTESYIHVGNAGDSRGILIQTDKVVPLSFDHKPDHVEESVRIYKYGGFCTPASAELGPARVNGELAVSRAIGDYHYKKHNLVKGKISNFADQPVSAKPDVISVKRNHADDRFIVLACDGLWDVMTNEEVRTFILERAEKLVTREAIAVAMEQQVGATSAATFHVDRPSNDPKACAGSRGSSAFKQALSGSFGRLSFSSHRATKKSVVVNHTGDVVHASASFVPPKSPAFSALRGSVLPPAVPPSISSQRGVSVPNALNQGGTTGSELINGPVSIVRLDAPPVNALAHFGKDRSPPLYSQNVKLSPSPSRSASPAPSEPMTWSHTSAQDPSMSVASLSKRVPSVPFSLNSFADGTDDASLEGRPLEGESTPIPSHMSHLQLAPAIKDDGGHYSDSLVTVTKHSAFAKSRKTEISFGMRPGTSVSLSSSTSDTQLSLHAALNPSPNGNAVSAVGSPVLNIPTAAVPVTLVAVQPPTVPSSSTTIPSVMSTNTSSNSSSVIASAGAGAGAVPSSRVENNVDSYLDPNLTIAKNRNISVSTRSLTSEKEVSVPPEAPTAFSAAESAIPSTIDMDDLVKICTALTDEALRRGSKDNITIILLALPAAFSPMPEAPGSSTPAPQRSVSEIFGNGSLQALKSRSGILSAEFPPSSVPSGHVAHRPGLQALFQQSRTSSSSMSIQGEIREVPESVSVESTTDVPTAVSLTTDVTDNVGGANLVHMQPLPPAGADEQLDDSPVSRSEDLLDSIVGIESDPSSRDTLAAVDPSIAGAPAGPAGPPEPLPEPQTLPLSPEVFVGSDATEIEVKTPPQHEMGVDFPPVPDTPVEPGDPGSSTDPRAA